MQRYAPDLWRERASQNRALRALRRSRCDDMEAIDPVTSRVSGLRVLLEGVEWHPVVGDLLAAICARYRRERACDARAGGWRAAGGGQRRPDGGTRSGAVARS